MEYKINEAGDLMNCTVTTGTLRFGPDVKAICVGAFVECDRLERLILPEAVSFVEAFACGSMKNLSELIIEGEETFIDTCAFMNCAKLKSVRFPPGNRSIAGDAFIGTPWLKTLPHHAWIRDGVLLCYGGDAEAYTIPEGVTEIGEGAFFNSKSLRHVVIGGAVRQVGAGAFALCDALEYVQLCGEPLIAPDAFDGTPWLKRRSGGNDNAPR